MRSSHAFLPFLRVLLRELGPVLCQPAFCPQPRLSLSQLELCDHRSCGYGRGGLTTPPALRQWLPCPHAPPPGPSALPAWPPPPTTLLSRPMAVGVASRGGKAQTGSAPPLAPPCSFSNCRLQCAPPPTVPKSAAWCGAETENITALDHAAFHQKCVLTPKQPS